MRLAQNATDIEVSYELPDGNNITIGNERFRAPEVLFNPALIGKEAMGVHESMFDTIIHCDVDVRDDLFANIVLSGGNTLFDGINFRLEKELTTLVPPAMNVTVYAPPERKYSVFIGGSILCSLDSFQPMWILRHEYDDAGAAIVHRKCF